MSVYFGYHMPTFTFPPVPPEGLFDHVVDLAVAAEAAGFDHVTVMDHFYQIRGVGPETEPMLEAYTTLGGLAARTTRISLGALVTGVTYRNPALVAKMATTLDVIASGRTILGMGAAWNEDEHAGYGYGFPPIGERMDRLDEALRIVKLMFTEERPSRCRWRTSSTSCGSSSGIARLKDATHRPSSRRSWRRSGSPPMSGKPRRSPMASRPTRRRRQGRRPRRGRPRSSPPTWRPGSRGS